MPRLGFLSVASLTLILLIGFVIYPLLPSLLPTIPQAHAATRSIALSGCASTIGCPRAGWNGTTTSPNPTITVRQSDTVSLSLTSADGFPHQFLLDVDRDGVSDTADCNTVDPCSMTFSTSIGFSFNVNFAAGTYTYFCVVHPNSMLGSFVVLPGNFSISSPPTLRVVAGTSGTSRINLTSTSFSGTVSLASSVAPSTPTITSNLSPTSLSLTFGGLGSSNLTVSAATSAQSGIYTVNVTGTSGSVSHTTTVTVTVSGGTVGGVLVPVDKLALLFPYLTIISIAALAAATAIYLRHSRAKRTTDNRDEFEEHRVP